MNQVFGFGAKITESSNSLYFKSKNNGMETTYYIVLVLINDLGKHLNAICKFL